MAVSTDRQATQTNHLTLFKKREILAVSQEILQDSIRYFIECVENVFNQIEERDLVNLIFSKKISFWPVYIYSFFQTTQQVIW